MQIKYGAKAKLDLIEIRQHFLDAGGKPLASRMVRAIRQEIDLLASHPEAAPLYEIVPGVRRLVVASGAYLVFYRVTSHVQVLHIRRGERAPATEVDF